MYANKIIGVIGFAFTVIGCLLYNFITGKVDGIEFTLEDIESE